jgi:hypothetical protein
MRVGQRIGSARRLSFLPANCAKTKSPRHEHRGLCQQYVSNRLSESLVPCIGVLQAFAGHGVGGVGASSSSVDRLTDVPKVRLVRHRRKSFALVPRMRIFSEVQLRAAEHSSVRRVMSSSCSHPSPVKRFNSSIRAALRLPPPSGRSLRRFRRRGAPKRTVGIRNSTTPTVRRD